MPEPAHKPVDGSDRPDQLAELRRLLAGAEFDRLARLEARVADSARFERALSNSIRRDPRAVAESIFPIIGPAIRRWIAASLKDFAGTVTQVVERSLSFRGIRWRIESLVSGKPFGEILLARSLLYSVEQVFLINRESGLLLGHAAAEDAVVKDADMVSGMLTAIGDFVSDSFAEPGHDLETVDIGHFRLWITYAPKIMLAGVVSGTPPAALKEVFRRALDGIDASLRERTGDFKQSDSEEYEAALPFLKDCLRGQRPAHRKKVGLWPFAAAAVVIFLAAQLAQVLYTRAQWNRYFETLKLQPGIVVTSVEKRGPQWLVSGLKDPDAPDPTSLLREHNLQQDQIRFSWQPYLSLSTPFAAQRELKAVIGRIRRQVIRFDRGTSKLAASAYGIDDLSGAIADLARLRPDSRVAVIGHADEAASAPLNEKLSLDRAHQVVDALVAQGARQEMLVVTGVGSGTPPGTGSSYSDRYAYRSVSFDVAIP